MKHSFCDDWEFTHHWTEAFGKGLPVPKQQAVRLPHTCREVPLHYASPADYEMVCGCSSALGAWRQSAGTGCTPAVSPL